MAKADFGRASEQRKSQLFDQPVTGPAVVAVGVGQTEHAAPVVERKLAAGGFAVSGNGAAPIGMVAVRLGLGLEPRADVADEPLRLGSDCSEGGRQLSSMEYDRVARVLAMARRGPR